MNAVGLVWESNVVPDRGHLSPDSGVGFDTIALTGPSDLSNLNELSKIWRRRSVDYSSGEIRDSLPGGVGWLDVGHARARVAVYGQAATMRLEVSAPRMMRGNNWDGLGLHLLGETVEFLLSSAAASLPCVPRIRDVSVTRLDLTRDFFGVRSPSATLAQIAQHPVARATVEDRHLRPDLGLQTLVRGNRNYWIVRGYDKIHEIRESIRSEGRDPAAVSSRPSQLRFELELKSKELKRRGLSTIQRLMEADLVQLAREHFEKCKFDVNTGEVSLNEVMTLMAAEGVSVADLRSLLVYLTCHRMGVEPLLSRHTMERSRSLANRYGLGPQSIGTATFTRRLDFDLGVELVD